MKTVHERFVWAVDLLDGQPSDFILEIGCGVGIAVDLIARRLQSGMITAVDRSEAMIALAVKRNREHIEAGRAEFFTGEFADMRLPDRRYDKVFAFNVSAFWKDPVGELQTVRSHLADDGLLYLFHQPPYDITRRIAEQASAQLRDNGFDSVQTVIGELHPVPAFCIISRPER